MFRAVWRLFRSIGYLLTGRIDAARKSLSSQTAVINSTYDEVIKQKIARIQDFKQAVGMLVSQQETRKQRLSTATTEVVKLEKLRAGALAKAQDAANRLRASGVSDEDVAKNSDIIKCQGDFSDFSSSLKSAQARVSELEGEIKDDEQKLAGYKRSLEGLLRDVETVKSEKNITIAEVISAKQRKEIADMLNGISADTTSEQLQEMRDLRNSAKAEAKVSEELAGTTVLKSEEDYLAYAENNEANSEFINILGLKKDKPVVQETVKLPEN